MATVDTMDTEAVGTTDTEGKKEIEKQKEGKSQLFPSFCFSQLSLSYL